MMSSALGSRWRRKRQRYGGGREAEWRGEEYERKGGTFVYAREMDKREREGGFKERRGF